MRSRRPDRLRATVGAEVPHFSFLLAACSFYWRAPLPRSGLVSCWFSFSFPGDAISRCLSTCSSEAVFFVFLFPSSTEMEGQEGCGPRGVPAPPSGSMASGLGEAVAAMTPACFSGCTSPPLLRCCPVSQIGVKDPPLAKGRQKRNWQIFGRAGCRL